jgi:hypothetical protein
MCYCFSNDLIPAYWCVIDSQVTSYQHTEILLILMWPYSRILKHCWFSCVLMCYWFSYDLSPAYWCLYRFSCDLIPAYWCIVDSYSTSFHHTNALLILMPPHSSILILMWHYSSIIIYYWLSWNLISEYWSIIDCQVTSF